MNIILAIIKEQVDNFPMIRRIARYDDRDTYQSHYLGILWEFLNPVIQIWIYYIVFGVALKHNNPLPHIPYLPWMITGMAAWLYMSKTTLDVSRSMYTELKMVSRMKFPISILPSIKIMGNLYSFWTMIALAFVFILKDHISPSIKIVQFAYYFFCMIVFMYAIGIFNATVSILIRDWHVALQSILRLTFYLSGVIFNFVSSKFSPGIVRLLEINPFFYIINGMRQSLLSRGWFWQQPTLNMTITFWTFVFVFIALGTFLYNKFRADFADLI